MIEFDRDNNIAKVAKHGHRYGPPRLNSTSRQLRLGLIHGKATEKFAQLPSVSSAIVCMFWFFAMRARKLRVISFRKANRKERDTYYGKK